MAVPLLCLLCWQAGSCWWGMSVTRALCCALLRPTPPAAGCSRRTHLAVAAALLLMAPVAAAQGLEMCRKDLGTAAAAAAGQVQRSHQWLSLPLAVSLSKPSEHNGGGWPAAAAAAAEVVALLCCKAQAPAAAAAAAAAQR